MLVRTFSAALALTLATAAQAQHGGPPTAASRVAPPEAAQYNFLIGQWDLNVKPAAAGLAQRIHGTPKLVGTLKAWREYDGWGVEDEMRITDASGNPMSLTHAMLFYDPSAKKWKNSMLDVYRGVYVTVTGEWRGGEMTTMSSGVDQEGKSYLSRGRYTAITRDSFTLIQERSTDNGQSWDANLTIEAKRKPGVAPKK